MNCTLVPTITLFLTLSGRNVSYVVASTKDRRFSSVFVFNIAVSICETSTYHLIDTFTLYLKSTLQRKKKQRIYGKYKDS